MATERLPESPCPDLTGKVALVTGAGKRIGRALALSLGAHGAAVAVHYNRSREEAEEVVALVRNLGSPAMALQADLRDAARAGRLIEETVHAWGQVDILVNSASVFERGTLLDTDEDNWDTHMAVNLKAPFFLCQAFARQAGERQGLQIINITDWRIQRPGISYLAYAISKAGLETLTRSLALALGPRVRVNAIAPGAILPPPEDEGDYFRRLAQRLPLKRTGSPDDVVRAMLYLLTAEFVTGEVILVDGGEHL